MNNSGCQSKPGVRGGHKAGGSGMLNMPLTGRGAAVRVFLSIDPPPWLGYIRQYRVTLLPAVQHLMALELSLERETPSLWVHWCPAQWLGSPPTLYLLIVCIFQVESIWRVPSIVIFLQLWQKVVFFFRRPNLYL